MLFWHFVVWGEMSKKKNPLVFLDVSIGGDPVERIVIEVSQKPAARFLLGFCFLFLLGRNLELT